MGGQIASGVAVMQVIVSAERGALADDSKTLSKLIGRPTTPMADTVAEAF